MVHPLPAATPPCPAPDTNPCRKALRKPIEDLLRDLGPALRKGDDLIALPSLGRSTGVAAVDRLLGGGFPRGRLSEITGPASAGRTSLAFCLLRCTTRSGEFVAVVDPADAFDPASADRAGVVLDRVLWTRAPSWKQALRCTERLLQTEGFPVVLLDLVDHEEAIAAAAWIRLARLAAGNQSTLVLLSRQRLAGTHAAVTLGLQAARAHFVGNPALLDFLESTAFVLRHRQAPLEEPAPMRFAGPSLA